MLISKPFYRTSSFWRVTIPVMLFLLWVVLFYQEIGLAMEFFLNGAAFPSTGIPAADYRYAILVIVISALAFIVYFYASMYFVSQFVLPVRQPKERRQVFDRLLRYLSAAHGPAVFIREGKEVANKTELQSSLPGVAFVDLNSAIVLERQPSEVKPESEATNDQTGHVVREAISGARKTIEGSEQPRKKKAGQALAKAVGPGIVFTSRGERIRGVVSLRNQVASADDFVATTRDGFQVKGNLSTVFSLGMAPDVVRIGFCAEPDDPDPFRPANLRDVKVEDNCIKEFVDQLDLADQQEAYVYAMRARPTLAPALPVRQSQSGIVKPVYVFDADRVFRAVYAEARRVDSGDAEVWKDLPLRVASEILKTMLAGENYSDLYRPENPSLFPLTKTFLPGFTRAVRNQGVLSFQFVRRKDGLPLLVGQDWRDNDLDIFSVQPLRGSKVLRDRGIRIISASCSELHPVKPAVSDALIDFWRAKQQRDADLKRAPYDYKRIHVAAEARINAQQQIIGSLQKILEDTSIPRGAVALRFLQAMQTLAKDPQTERILPQETLQLMDKFQSWFWGNQGQGGEE